MAVVMNMRWTGVTVDQYEAARQAVGWEADVPPGRAACRVLRRPRASRHRHLDPAAHFDRFVEERLGPATQQLGIEGQPEVVITEVHRTFSPRPLRALTGRATRRGPDRRCLGSRAHTGAGDGIGRFARGRAHRGGGGVGRRRGPAPGPGRGPGGLPGARPLARPRRLPGGGAGLGAECPDAMVGLAQPAGGTGGLPIDDSSSDISILNYNGVGGGTVLYNAQWPRMAPADFAVRSVDGIADDWPLRYEDLLPYYEQTDREIGVSGLGGNPMFPPGADPPLPPLPIGRAGLLLARAHDRLGWHWWPDTNAILSAPYLGRRPCVQRAACGQGCAEGAKSSTDLSHLPGAMDAGARVIVGARVHRLAVDRRGLVTGAEWTDGDGTRRFQSADVVLLACNGIGTPRLLLNSLRTVPRGAGQRLGAGRQEADAAPPRDGDRLLRPRAPELAGAGRGRHPVDGVLPERRGTRVRAWGALEPGPDGWAPAQRPRRSRSLRLGSRAPSRVPPPLRTRCGLGAHLRGPPGGDQPGRALPGPRRLLWRSRPTDRLPGEREFRSACGNGMRDGRSNPSERQERTPPRSPWWDETGTSWAPHGMGEDPDASVVDPWGMAHDVPNLGIIDGSVFVTVGGANPTSTIVSLALRAADHLLERRSSLPTPERTRTFAVAGATIPPARPRVAASVSAASTPLTDSERDILSLLADELIPAADDMPAASEVGVHAALADRVLGYRPDLAHPLRRALATAAPRPRHPKGVAVCPPRLSTSCAASTGRHTRRCWSSSPRATTSRRTSAPGSGMPARKRSRWMPLRTPST